MICRMCRGGKYVLFAGALIAGGLIAASRGETVTGSGIPGTQDRVIDAVDEVVLSGSGNLMILRGDVPTLTVTADDNLLPLIETETSSRQLRIGTKSGYTLRPKTPLKYTLTLPRLEKLTLSGTGTVRASSFSGNTLTIRLSGSADASLHELEYRELSLNVSGSGTVNLGGTATRATVRVSGSGDVDATELRSLTSEVRVSGSGRVHVWATQSLKARVSGSGEIGYRGEPKIEKRVSGSGGVKPVD